MKNTFITEKKMFIEDLKKILKGNAIIFTPEEFAEMMRPYEFTMKVAQNLGKLESVTSISLSNLCAQTRAHV